MRRAAPFLIAGAVFVLSWPLICVGSSERSRGWCENAVGWPLPWSRNPGDGAGALMFAIPLVAAVAMFALTWAVLHRPRDRDAATSRS